MASATETIAPSSIGYKGVSRSVRLGHWQGSVGNSILNKLYDMPPFDHVKYSARFKGVVGKQKAVIAAIEDHHGPDRLVEIDTSGIDLEVIRESLDRHGIENRTLLSPGGDAKLVLVDSAGRVAKNVEAFAGELQRPADVARVRGEFIGDAGREAAQASYEELSSPFLKDVTGQPGWPNGFQFVGVRLTGREHFPHLTPEERLEDEANAARKYNREFRAWISKRCQQNTTEHKD